jgi:diguanylate cyclase (GGDEF)-like protein
MVGQSLNRRGVRPIESDMNARSWRWYLLLGGLAALPVVAIPDSWWYTAWYDLLGLSSVVAILVGARVNRTRTRATWRWLAAGQLLFVAGDLLFDLNERVWATDQFPSVADAFYLAGYLPLTIGLVLLIRARTPGRDVASLIDATIIATGLGLLSWVFLIKPAATDSTLTILGRVTSIAYPTADVLLLALLARLLIGAGVHNAAFRLLAGSLVIMLVGDVGFAVLAQYDAFTPNNVINITWLLAYVLFGAAALHPSMATLSNRAIDRPRRLTRKRLSLLSGVSLIAPVLLLGQAYGRSGIDATAIGIGAIVLFLLVVARMYGLIRQVEEQAARLETLAQHDPLTGAANRRAWDHSLPVEIDRARRMGTPLALAVLDLDHFKQFNDEYGHQAGDQLLKSATAVWQTLLRPSDLLARLGGEEFAVLLPTATMEQAMEVVDRLREATPLAQSFSAGVALWDGDETSDQIVARADYALYQAKRDGRNKVLPAGTQARRGRGDLPRKVRVTAADRPTP